MVIPNYRDFRGSKFIVTSSDGLTHSAKGSTWKEHKYIKRVDGTYYYPENYKGGRTTSNSKEELEDWEKTMYDDIDNTLKKNPGLFDPKEIASDGFQDFKVTLSEFAGVDTDNLSSDEIERMRKKVQDHYSDEKSTSDLSKNDVENLARETIRGNFGNGEQRKELLGDNYDEVQERVNELLKSSVGSKKISEISKETIKKLEKIPQKHLILQIKKSRSRR